ncbi:MAG: M15 family metallopeptidase [Lysobacterales bacterium]|jgi:D-alanyl-D-alanine dipeptidase
MNRFVLMVVAGFLNCAGLAAQPPAGFIEIRDVAPGVRVELRYSSGDNFVGRPVTGYEADRCFVTREAGAALAAVQRELAAFGLGLKVFDAYRPQRAVDHFVRWAADLDDTETKAAYYPRVAKQHLFRDGYIAARSGHSRGSTVDLTIVWLDGDDLRELDMGTPFDFFGPESHGASAAVTPQQRANRALLQALMTKHGFRPLAEEWWHFTLEDEPYPDTYFDFVIE